VSRLTALITEHDRSTWLLLLTALGVFFAADDQTSVVAILPNMVKDVGLAQDQFYRAAWIVNGYILGYVVAMPLMGRVADSYGHGRIFAAALLLFTAGSAWVALSQGLTMVSIARGVQAVGGGGVVPVSMAIVTANASRSRRVLGLGAIAAASEAGGLIGPLWGGGIAELMGWRGVFWINLPLCLPIALAVLQLAKHDDPTAKQSLDLPGATLLAASLVCLTVALTDDPIARRDTVVTLLLFAGAAVFFAGFIWRELHASDALVNLSLFRAPRLSAAFLANGLTGGTLIVAMVAVPLFTNVLLNGSALEGGLNLMRLTVALPVGALAGGYLATRFGLTIGAAAGLILAGIGFLGMATWSEDPSFAGMTLPLLVAGLGFGLVIAPINAAVMDEAADDQRATLASLLTVVRLVGALVGVALLTTRGLSGFYSQAGQIALDDPRFESLLRGLQIHSFRDTFIVTGVVCFTTVIPALFLGKSNIARETNNE
jgi:MFS transporter, DHA2 family, triacylglyceride efflux pump